MIKKLSLLFGIVSLLVLNGCATDKNICSGATYTCDNDTTYPHHPDMSGDAPE